jgi:glycosyltransferase involved in cell wall biosynthesis
MSAPPPPLAAEAARPARISVLIATRDRPESFARCLPTVLANDYPNFEVVVVDQSTSADSERVVASIGDGRLRYLRQQAAGLSLARNAAMREASGAIFAFTDDDCTVAEQWLRRIAAVFAADEGAGLIFGAFRAIPHDSERYYVPSFSPARYRRLSGRAASRFNRNEAGGNMAVRRSVVDVAGEFDLCLGPGAIFPGGDDSDLNDRVLRAGFAVIHDPDNVVVHWGARAYDDGSARQLLLDGSLAAGAILAKELRCGDPVAPYRLARTVVTQGSAVTFNVLTRHHPTGGGRLRSTLAGFWRGMRHPLDRDRRLFVPRTGRIR